MLPWIMHISDIYGEIGCKAGICSIDIGDMHNPRQHFSPIDNLPFRARMINFCLAITEKQECKDVQFFVFGIVPYSKRQALLL